MKPIFKKTVAALLLSSFVGGQAWATSENDVLFNCILSPQLAPSMRLAVDSSGTLTGGKTYDTLKVRAATYTTPEIFTMMNINVYKNALGNLTNYDWLLMTIKQTNCVGSSPSTPYAGESVQARECALTGNSVLNLYPLSDGTYTIRPSTDHTLFLTLDNGNVVNSSSYYLRWQKWGNLTFNRNQKWLISCQDMKGQPQSPPTTASAL